MKKIGYLAGHIKELEYRKIVIEKYGDKFIFHDPCNFDVEKKAKELQIDATNISEVSEAIVRTDKNMILGSDFVIAYINKPTFGTIMEVMFAYDHNIPVYVINENEQFINDFWLFYHSKEIFTSIDSCFEYLILNGI